MRDMPHTDTPKRYKEFTTETVISFAKSKGWYSLDSKVDAKEIGDGNLNYVFHLQDEQGKSIIIKQSLPYAKVVGESWPLTIKRATIEAEALKKQGKFVPHLVPKVFYTDEELAITVMEDLSQLTIAREGLVEGNYYPKLAEDLATFLANTLFFTSDFGLHPFEKKKLQVEFSNPELCKITEDLIFTDPYYNIETNDFEKELIEEVENIWKNEALKLEVAKIKYSFLTEGEALLHGDLHTGSVFVSSEETKVIDPEFAFYGPIGFDVGQVIANLLFQYFVRKGSAQQQILEDVKTVWTVFEEKFKILWHENNQERHANVPGFIDSIIAKIFKDTIGFAGTEFIRRTIGLAHVKDLDSIENDSERLQAKKNVLSVGEKLILKRESIKNIDELLQEVVGVPQS